MTPLQGEGFSWASSVQLQGTEIVGGKKQLKHDMTVVKETTEDDSE